MERKGSEGGEEHELAKSCSLALSFWHYSVCCSWLSVFSLSLQLFFLPLHPGPQTSLGSP